MKALDVASWMPLLSIDLRHRVAAAAARQRLEYIAMVCLVSNAGPAQRLGTGPAKRKGRVDVDFRAGPSTRGMEPIRTSSHPLVDGLPGAMARLARQFVSQLWRQLLSTVRRRWRAHAHHETCQRLLGEAEAFESSQPGFASDLRAAVRASGGQPPDRLPS